MLEVLKFRKDSNILGCYEADEALKIGLAATKSTLRYDTGTQSWEKLIVIDIRLGYSIKFVHRMHWSLYFFE